MQTKNQIDMTTGGIVQKLLIFSIPIIFSGILQLVFNAADIIVVGQFAGEESLAAVGATSSLINLLIGLFTGLATGTNVIAANYLGAQKLENVKKTVHTSIIVSIFAGIFLTIIGISFAKPILKLMKIPSEVLPLATVYLKIYFGGITTTMLYNFGSSLLRAKGDTKRPLYVLLIAGIINVILNLLFVIVFKMNVAGVALATIISQGFSAVCILFMLVQEKNEFKLTLKNLKFDKHIFIKMIKIGVPAGFQGMMFSFSNVIIQSAINSFGAVIIAGNSAALSIEGFVYIAMNGFAQGTLTFTSQNYGAKKYDRIKTVAITSEIIVFLIGTILGGIVILFSEQILSLYTKSQDALEAGKIRLLVICSVYCLCGMMDVIGNIIRGIGHSILPMIVTLAGACGLRILWIATLFQIPKFHSTYTIYFSYPVSWLITFLIEVICFTFIFRKMKNCR
jgi:putative MATE family efflux protein